MDSAMQRTGIVMAMASEIEHLTKALQAERARSAYLETKLAGSLAPVLAHTAGPDKAEVDVQFLTFPLLNKESAAVILGAMISDGWLVAYETVTPDKTWVCRLERDAEAKAGGNDETQARGAADLADETDDDDPAPEPADSDDTAELPALDDEDLVIALDADDLARVLAGETPAAPQIVMPDPARRLIENVIDLSELPIASKMAAEGLGPVLDEMNSELAGVFRRTAAEARQRLLETVTFTRIPGHPETAYTPALPLLAAE